MNWVYFASGFRESRGTTSGTKELFRAIRDEYQSEYCCIFYNEYNDEPKKWAQDLASQWQDGDNLVVYGYSWGAGRWVRKFLWELYRLNPKIKVNHLILIDPVYYSKWPWMRWRAIGDWAVIKLPDNILNSRVFYQRIDEPNASRVKIAGGLQPNWSMLDYPHTKIDDSPEVAEFVMIICEELLDKGVA